MPLAAVTVIFAADVGAAVHDAVCHAAEHGGAAVRVIVVGHKAVDVVLAAGDGRGAPGALQGGVGHEVEGVDAPGFLGLDKGAVQLIEGGVGSDLVRPLGQVFRRDRFSGGALQVKNGIGGMLQEVEDDPGGHLARTFQAEESVILVDFVVAGLQLRRGGAEVNGMALEIQAVKNGAYGNIIGGDIAVPSIVKDTVPIGVGGIAAPDLLEDGDARTRFKDAEDGVVCAGARADIKPFQGGSGGADAVDGVKHLLRGRQEGGERRCSDGGGLFLIIRLHGQGLQLAGDKAQDEHGVFNVDLAVPVDICSRGLQRVKFQQARGGPQHQRRVHHVDLAAAVDIPV